MGGGLLPVINLNNDATAGRGWASEVDLARSAAADRQRGGTRAASGVVRGAHLAPREFHFGFKSGNDRSSFLPKRVQRRRAQFYELAYNAPGGNYERAFAPRVGRGCMGQIERERSSTHQAALRCAGVTSGRVCRGKNI